MAPMGLSGSREKLDLQTKKWWWERRVIGRRWMLHDWRIQSSRPVCFTRKLSSFLTFIKTCFVKTSAHYTVRAEEVHGPIESHKHVVIGLELGLKARWHWWTRFNLMGTIKTHSGAEILRPWMERLGHLSSCTIVTRVKLSNCQHSFLLIALSFTVDHEKRKVFI